MRLAVAIVSALVVAATSAATAGASKPLVGAIRWDAWHPANTTSPSAWVTPKLYSDWTSREPLQGWHLYGSGVDTSSLVRQEIDWAADHGVDYWAFVWYDANNPHWPARELMRPYQAYRAAPNRNRLKFSFIVGTQGVASDYHEPRWRSEYVPEFVDAFKDRHYLRVSGNRPVLYWFGSSALSTQPDGFGSEWAAQLQYLRDRTRAAVDESGRPLGAPLLVDVTHDVSGARNHGLEAAASYGPAGAVAPAPSGCFDPKARSWSAQAAKDLANLTDSAPLLAVPSPTPVNDPRPRDSDPDYLRRIGLPQGYGYWSQPPTYGQWEAHFGRLYDWAAENPGRTTNPPLMLIYAWNELDEGGAGIVPTKQERFKYLEGIGAVTSGWYPGKYVDVYNADNCAIRFGGPGWIRYPGVRSAHDDDVQISWTSGDSATLDVPSTTQFAVRFSRGPDRGNVDISIDGRHADTLSLYAPTYDWYEYRSAVLARGAHTITIRVRADRDPRSSGNQVPVDRISAVVDRTTAWEFNRDGDLAGWSPDYQATASVSGGALRVTARGPDPQVYNPSWGSSGSLRLAARTSRYVHIRMRNNTGATTATLYFLTDTDQTWNGAKSKSFSIAPNSGYVDYILDMSTVPTWRGTIRKLRLDPGDPSISGGTYDIDFIRTR